MAGESYQSGVSGTLITTVYRTVLQYVLRTSVPYCAGAGWHGGQRRQRKPRKISLRRAEDSCAAADSAALDGAGSKPRSVGAFLSMTRLPRAYACSLRAITEYLERSSQYGVGG